MKKVKLLTPILLILLLVSVVGCANEFNDGLGAFKQKDYRVAFEKWEPLAEQGHDDAQYKLGKMYREGLGVSQNYIEAYKWYYIVAKKGYGGGYKYMKLIKRDISSAQVSRAEKLAMEWMKEHEQ